jgi:hypothetical protein
LTSDRGAVWRLDTIPNRRLALLVACAGFLLVLPSLGNGLQILDDVPQRDFILAKLHGDAWAQNRPWYDVYNLVSGDAKLAAFTRYFWVTPWWTWLGLKVQFFRPVSAATLYVDYAVFGQHYWLAHLHSALWYFAACGLVCSVTLQISRSRSTALLGALLFALDDSHSSAVSWLAGRNAVVGVAWFAAALSLYVLASRRHQLRWLTASAACLLIALLAAENVSSTIPFFIAYSLLLDERPLERRLRDPIAILIVAGAWFIIHKALGFGSLGSGAYLDPIRDGASFWQALPGRILGLLHLQFGPPWALFPHMPFSLFILLDSFGRWVVLPLLALFVVARMNREIAFWTLSATLGLVPLVAGAPHDRLLTHVGVAWWMLLAHLIVALLRFSTQAPRVLAVGAWLVTGSLLFVHAILAPLSLALGVNSQRIPEVDAKSLDAISSWWTREVIALNVPTMFVVAQLSWQRERKHLPRPQQIAVLGATERNVEVVRKDDKTIELYCKGGYLVDVFSTFWRGPGVPLRKDELTVVHEFAVTVLSLTPDHRPERLRVQFVRSLDDSALFFVEWRDNQFKPFSFAPVGSSRVIPSVFEPTPGAGSVPGP